MTNVDTIIAITENICAVARGEGIRLSPGTNAQARNAPASAMPVGEIVYTGETFEDSCGQRPCYVTAVFSISVDFPERHREDIIRAQQAAAHKLRGALTVSGLNIGALVASKPISSARITEVQARMKDDVGSVNCILAVRYRETV
ncbi:MAG: hypothetical protein HY886_07180 [Deltaproteobacteria bacterium]|nr:hypothetical protein [Deltaproteobacteria bacterium]